MTRQLALVIDDSSFCDSFDADVFLENGDALPHPVGDAGRRTPGKLGVEDDDGEREDREGEGHEPVQLRDISAQKDRVHQMAELRRRKRKDY